MGGYVKKFFYVIIIAIVVMIYVAKVIELVRWLYQP